MRPSQVLARLCREARVDGPHFIGRHSVRVGDKVFTVERSAVAGEAECAMPDKSGE